MRIPKHVTDVAIGLFLTNLCERGEAIPKAVLNAWIRSKRCDVTLNPAGFSDPRSFSRAYQASSFFKKYTHLDAVDDAARRNRAINKFLDRDLVCAETSVRFCNLHSIDQHHLARLHRAREICCKILGEFSWDDAVSLCDFGPGASLGVPRRLRHKVNKIGNPNPTVTGPCHVLLTAYRRWAPLIEGVLGDPIVVAGNVVTTVPKTAEIDRVIATEPLWNMFFQKGVGALIKHRLRRIGLDLTHQQEVNRLLACEGSKYGNYATLDLSAASDSISLEFVRFMVPPSWWDAFVITRSPYSEVNGTRVLLKKIASMGNGFCFELETILFLSLALAVCPSRASKVNVDVAVYGDDIIIRPEVAHDLSGLLGVAGFKINPEKSFITGPFRESCGGHFFDGFDVTPYMLTKELTTVHDLFWFMNSVRRWASRQGESLYCDSIVREVYDFVKRFVPPRLRRCLIPPGLGDDGIMSSFDEACPTPARDCGTVVGMRYTAFARSPRKRHHDGIPAVLMSIYEMERASVLGASFTRSSGKLSVDVRDAHWRALDEETGFRLRIEHRVIASQWEWLGSWA